MIINKQIVLDLLFEHLRIELATVEPEKQLGDKVAFASDICLHGTNIFDIVCNNTEIELNEDNFETYYKPFYDIINSDFKNTEEVKTKIEGYYDWLTRLTK